MPTTSTPWRKLRRTIWIASAALTATAQAQEVPQKGGTLIVARRREPLGSVIQQLQRFALGTRTGLF
jgi:hypothetical protein